MSRERCWGGLRRSAPPVWRGQAEAMLEEALLRARGLLARGLLIRRRRRSLWMGMPMPPRKVLLRQSSILCRAERRGRRARRVTRLVGPPSS